MNIYELSRDLLALSLLVCALPAAGIDVAQNPALPQGPVSQGWWIAQPSGSEIEIASRFSQMNGSDTKTREHRSEARSDHQSYHLGASTALNDHFSFHTMIGYNHQSIQADGKGTLDYEYTMERSDLDLQAGPQLHSQTLTLGAWVGVTSFGAEKKAIHRQDLDLRADTAATWLPYFTGVAGIKSESTRYAVEIRFFNSARVDSEIQSSLHGNYNVELNRHKPAKISFKANQSYHGRLFLGSLISYEFLAQGDPSINELSANRPLSANGNITQSSSSDLRLADRLNIAMSSAYAAQPGILFTGSLRYAEDSVARNEYMTSVRPEDRGGISAGIGLSLGQQSRFLIDLLYSPERKTRYRLATPREDAWAEPNDDILVKLSGWDFAIGYVASL